MVLFRLSYKLVLQLVEVTSVACLTKAAPVPPVDVFLLQVE